MADAHRAENRLGGERRHFTRILRRLRQNPIGIAIGKAELRPLLHGDPKDKFPAPLFNLDGDACRYGSVLLFKAKGKERGICAELSVALDAKVAFIDFERDIVIEFFDRTAVPARRNDFAPERVPAEITHRMCLERFPVKYDSKHAEPHRCVVRNDIAVRVHRARVDEGAEHLNALVNGGKSFEQVIDLIHKPDDKELNQFCVRTRLYEPDKRFLRRRIRRIAVDENELGPRCFERRERQHNSVRIEAQISHLECTCMHQYPRFREYAPHIVTHPESLFHRHLAGGGNRDKQRLHMRDPLQFFLGRLRFALGIRGTGNDIRQLLHMPLHCIGGRPPRLFLLRVVHNARLANHRGLNLPRIFEIALNLLHNIMNEHCRARIIHLIRFDHHADLTACLDGKAALDPVKGFCNGLECFEPLDVGLQALAPCARTRRRHSICSCNEHSFDRRCLFVAMMRCDDVDDFL